MTLYNTELADISMQKRLLSVLVSYWAYDVLLNLLDKVTIKLLLQSYPAETSKWLMGKPHPADFLLHPDWHLDPRGTVLHLWKQIAIEISIDNSRERLSDGSESINWDNHDIVDKIVKELASLPFEQALATWLTIWKEWVLVSNVSELLQNFQQVRSDLKIDDLPRMMAEWVEYQHRLGGWQICAVSSARSGLTQRRRNRFSVPFVKAVCVA